MTTGQLATLLLLMGGGVILFVTAGFLYFKKFGRKATVIEHDKAVRLQEQQDQVSDR